MKTYARSAATELIISGSTAPATWLRTQHVAVSSDGTELVMVTEVKVNAETSRFLTVLPDFRGVQLY